MKRPLFLLVLAASAAACAPGDADSVKKEVADLRADLQKAQDDGRKLALRVEQQDRRIAGLAEDLAEARKMGVVVKEAPAGTAGATAATDGVPSASNETASAKLALSSPESAAIAGYLSTEAGKKVLAAAIQADRDARSKEQAQRQVEGAVDRFAKIANLTDDQTKRMKELMNKQAEELRDIFATARDLPPDATQQQRDDLRKQNVAKADEIRKETDDSLKTLLSQTQYEQYSDEAERMRAGLRGFAGTGAGAATGARRNRGGQTTNPPAK